MAEAGKKANARRRDTYNSKKSRMSWPRCEAASPSFNGTSSQP